MNEKSKIIKILKKENFNEKADYLGELQKIAKKKGGKLLSKYYYNNRTKLKFQCAKDHEWWAKPQSIKEGTWCPDCYRDIKGQLQELRQILESKGGWILSPKYKNAHTPLKFQCALGHEWLAKPNAIKTGRWCPRCSQGVNERICRIFFEKIFNKIFPTTKFKWLVNPEEKKLHLDGFNKYLNLAFEYQGIQHYKFKPHWHKTREIFGKRKRDDKIKRNLCQKHKINLIFVPYYITPDKMEDFIRMSAKRLGIETPEIKKKIDWKKFDIVPPDKLGQLQKIAKKKGGKLLSKYYYNNRTKLKFQCAKGHEWWAVPYHIKAGTWCPYCYNEKLEEDRKKKENKLRLIIESKGGTLLTPYINKRIKIKIKCSLDHTWKTYPPIIEGGSWCPHCHNKKEYYLNQLRKIAKEKGGNTLSKRYINNRTKLKFQCAKGHEWWAIPKSIKEGTWCPHCYKLGIKL